MSTLEKALTLMKTMPEHKIKTIYAFIRFMDSETEEPEEMTKLSQPEKKAKVQSMIGMAHKYANPALIEQEDGAFERAMAEKHASDRY
ncbi:MAG: hypothetical protein K1W06_07315 [Lachnospiraceae bacterium]